MRTALDLTGLSARNRRILALGIRGGDGDTPTPIEDLLGQASAVGDLADDDLGTLHELLAQAMVETLTGTVTDADLATADSIRTAMTALEGAAESRIGEQADRDSRAAELLASIAGPEDEGEQSDEETVESGAETETTETTGGDESTETETGETEAAEQERIAASADAPSVVTRVVARRPAPRRPAPTRAAPALALRSSATGRTLSDADEIGRELSQMLLDSDMMQPGRRVRVATMGGVGGSDVGRLYGEHRTLDHDYVRNSRKIDDLTSLPALRASGGVCAPSPINYNQGGIGTTARPVRDTMLAAFGADRGGVQIIAPPQLNDAAVLAGVTTWTNANDIALNSPSTKAVTTIDCPAAVTTTVDAIVQIAKIGNFQSRYFNERVQRFLDKLDQAQARIAERKLLTAIGAGSTQVAHQTVLGTARDVLAHVDQTASQMRSYHRLDPNFPIRAAFPYWLLANIRTDLVREQPGATAERLATTDAQIEEFFAVRNINTSWFLDGETGQEFGAQTDGAAVGWPSHVVGYMYTEGEWLFLDGGELNLGVVRDSTLNGTNDYEIFSESFENTARTRTGPSRRVDYDICPSGTTSLPVAISPCIAGS